MDPFSIVAGTAGLGDVCVRLVKFIKQAKHGVQTIDEELLGLLNEIETLWDLNVLIEDSVRKEAIVNRSEQSWNPLRGYLRAIKEHVSECQHTLQQIEALLRSILDKGQLKQIKLGQLQRWFNHQAQEGQLNALRQKLRDHQNSLQTGLAALNTLQTRISWEASLKSHLEISQSIKNLGVNLDCKIGYLQSSSYTPTEEIKLARSVYRNEHFYTPQTVSSTYVGRENELLDLKFHLDASNLSEVPSKQKRFVIFGLAGAGKTQFCCKFASDNKESYWGVFWVNASSKEHVQQSFSTISAIGKVAPNQAAVKSWLSSLGPECPWLLIVDNADEANFPVTDCFPESNFGVIIITTRNPTLKTHGNVGPRFLEFDGLEEDRSAELLLRTADEPKPWSSSAISSANTIAKTLGCLPLALVHAGKAILARLCTLDTYLDFFEKSWLRISTRKDHTTAETLSDTNATIYSTYELILRSLSEKNTQASADALDLLKIFAFFDRQHIRLDIFTRAAANPSFERLEKSRKDKENEIWKRSIPRRTWAAATRELATNIIGLLQQLGNCSALPKFLIEMSEKDNMADDIRIRAALNELSQMSLISMSPGRADCYSMHAAVHSWARQRPEMTLVEQAVWCQVTTNILSRSILLPPLGDTEDDETFRRDLLPHIRHVQQSECRIRTIFEKKRENRWNIIPIFAPPVTSDKLVQIVKFSLVYAHGHQLEEAERMQAYVAKFAIETLGMENIKTINIVRLLSWTYWQLARTDQAVAFQKKALDACVKVLGPEHPETLQVMDSYGSSLWLQGRIPEARKVHTAAVKGLKETMGYDHILTLKAMGGLGRIVGKDFDFNEAIEIQSHAFEGLKKQLGPSHSATLEAMDNLAMAHFDRAAYRRGIPGDLTRALELESEVYATRRARLGREHYHTLWSGLNLARIYAICGDDQKALETFLPGHAVVRRDLGETHFIYLFGELHHARILMCANRYNEAEQILINSIRSYPADRREHPDRLLAMFSLIKCRNVLGKADKETAVLLEALIKGTIALFGADHAAVTYLVDGEALSRDARDVLNMATCV